MRTMPNILPTRSPEVGFFPRTASLTDPLLDGYGLLLQAGQPSRKGIYIQNGRKLIVR